MADIYSLDGITHPVEGVVEEGDGYSAEEQIHGGCDAKTLSTRSKTLACDSKTLSSDWEGIENTRMSSGDGEGRKNMAGKTTTTFDSELECRDDDGAPASGSKCSSNSSTVREF